MKKVVLIIWEIVLIISLCAAAVITFLFEIQNKAIIVNGIFLFLILWPWIYFILKDNLPNRK